MMFSRQINILTDHFQSKTIEFDQQRPQKSARVAGSVKSFSACRCARGAVLSESSPEGPVTGKQRPLLTHQPMGIWDMTSYSLTWMTSKLDESEWHDSWILVMRFFMNPEWIWTTWLQGFVDSQTLWVITLRFTSMLEKCPIPTFIPLGHNHVSKHLPTTSPVSSCTTHISIDSSCLVTKPAMWAWNILAQFVENCHFNLENRDTVRDQGISVPCFQAKPNQSIFANSEWTP